LGASADETLKEIALRLRGKVAIVTGSATELGRGIIVERFCRARAAVVLTDIDAIDGKEAAETIRAGAGECFFTQRDVSREDVQQLAD
jgi:NAD(P)-dependent dehydrogenase (short-subunit alcohol dehydrogenase family)